MPRKNQVKELDRNVDFVFERSPWPKGDENEERKNKIKGEREFVRALRACVFVRLTGTQVVGKPG